MGSRASRMGLQVTLWGTRSVGVVGAWLWQCFISVLRADPVREIVVVEEGWMNHWE